MMRHHLALAALCVAVTGSPASAQLFQVPSQRTIVLSPGWHLDGPPVRSSEGLRFAVRNDAGVLQDMTVLRSGAIKFNSQEPGAKPAQSQKPSRAASARQHKPRSAVQHAAPAIPKAAEAARAAAAKPKEAARAPVATASAAAPDRTPARAPVPAPQPVPTSAPTPAQTGPGYAHGVPINPLE